MKPVLAAACAVLLTATGVAANGPDRDAFSHPTRTLNTERKLDFHLGKALFERPWVIAPASTQAADGLGPLYNARACADCHVRDGRGRPPIGGDRGTLVMQLSITDPSTPDALRPDPSYGRQLQTFAIPGLRAEGRVQARYRARSMRFADGAEVTLHEPNYTLVELAHGPLDPDTRLSPRIAPPLIGLGLLEAVAEADILALADPDDTDGDGISGRAHRVTHHVDGTLVVGRFGWQANAADVDTQSQTAFAIDMGIAVPQHPAGAGDCTPIQTDCLAAPDGNSPQYDNLEADKRVTDLVSHYVRHLAVPARRGADAPTVRAGERVFHALGCNACHHPTFTTAADAADAELAGRAIAPYTDLLLHDMGDALADRRSDGSVASREWRTAPLWGIGLTPVVSGHSRYLHDGRARDLVEAILWHDGEARPARDRFLQLPAHARQQLVTFIESL